MENCSNRQHRHRQGWSGKEHVITRGRSLSCDWETGGIAQVSGQQAHRPRGKLCRLALLTSAAEGSRESQTVLGGEGPRAPGLQGPREGL